MTPAANPKTICFDLDGTICTNTGGDYEAAEPCRWAIERINRLAQAGHRIVIFTARGTASGIDWEELTRAQLARWEVSHDELVFGKPSADVYVDDRTITTDSWRCGDAFRVPGFPGVPGPGMIEELPVPPPPHYSCLVEVGRASEGQAPEAARLAKSLVRRAAAAGLSVEVSPEELERMISEAVAATSGEVVFTVALAEPADPSLGEYAAPAPLTVSVRPARDGAGQAPDQGAGTVSAREHG